MDIRVFLIHSLQSNVAPTPGLNTTTAKMPVNLVYISYIVPQARLLGVHTAQLTLKQAKMLNVPIFWLDYILPQLPIEYNDRKS